MHVTDPADVAYVRRHFRAPSDAERARAARGLAPAPTYRLPDGDAVPAAAPDADLAAAVDSADLSARFARRFASAGGAHGDAHTELEAWLSGQYGACLPDPTPEAIATKTALATTIAALLAAPRPGDGWWRGTMRATVDAYDHLVMPFAPGDASRFGGSTSRQRLVDTPRTRWPALWQTPD